MPLCRGLQLDPGFISFDAEDDLDYSRVRQDKNLELWLLQIPVDVSCRSVAVIFSPSSLAPSHLIILNIHRLITQ